MLPTLLLVLYVPTIMTTVPSCELAWSPFLELQAAHAVYFPNTAAYDAFRGFGLGRTMHLFDSRSFPEANASQMHALLPKRSIRSGTCTSQTDKGKWYTQRIGPFRSIGGFDCALKQDLTTGS